MRHRILTAAALAITLVACEQPPPAPADPTSGQRAAPDAAAQADARFAEISARWLEGKFRLSPVYATAMGEHRFDGDVDDLSAAGRSAMLEFSRKTLAELAALDTTTLSRDNLVDALILRLQTP